MTPFGIEPAILRFVAQCLNHCATPLSVRYGLHSKYQKAHHLYDAEVCRPAAVVHQHSCVSEHIKTLRTLSFVGVLKTVQP